VARYTKYVAILVPAPVMISHGIHNAGSSVLKVATALKARP